MDPPNGGSVFVPFLATISASALSLSVLDVEEVLNEILHQAILLSHVPLKVDKFAQDVLGVCLHGSETRGRFIVTLGQGGSRV